MVLVNSLNLLFPIISFFSQISCLLRLQSEKKGKVKPEISSAKSHSFIGNGSY